MLFTTVLASAFTLAIGASAAPAPDANPRYAQLRIFGEPGCSELNQGEIGVYGDQLNKCQTFGDNTVRSVSFEYKLLNNCTRELLQRCSRLMCNPLIIFSECLQRRDLSSQQPRCRDSYLHFW